MKNTKICFHKSVGIVVLVILFIGIFTFLAFQLTKKPTSTNTRASTPKDNSRPSNYSKIVNGTEAEDGEFPFYAALVGTNGLIFCGGTLISEEWVVTAGHCITDYQAEFGLSPHTIEIIIGIDHINEDLKALHYSTIDNYLIHDDFLDEDDEVHNDIALLHLKNPAKHVPTLSLFNPQGGKYLEELGRGQLVTIIGLGRINAFIPSTSLRKTSLCKISTMDNYTHKDRIELELTADSYSYKGDSGSPVVFSYGSYTYLLGIVSHANSSSPEIEASVSHFYSWIYEKTGILADKGTYKSRMPNGDKRNWSYMKKKIPICSNIRNKIDCNVKNYLCSWDGESCINYP